MAESAGLYDVVSSNEDESSVFFVVSFSELLLLFIFASDLCSVIDIKNMLIIANNAKNIITSTYLFIGLFFFMCINSHLSSFVI